MCSIQLCVISSAITCTCDTRLRAHVSIWWEASPSPLTGFYSLNTTGQRRTVYRFWWAVKIAWEPQHQQWQNIFMCRNNSSAHKHRERLIPVSRYSIKSAVSGGNLKLPSKQLRRMKNCKRKWTWQHRFTHSQSPACPGCVLTPHGESTCWPPSSFCSITPHSSAPKTQSQLKCIEKQQQTVSEFMLELIY